MSTPSCSSVWVSYISTQQLSARLPYETSLVLTVYYVRAGLEVEASCLTNSMAYRVQSCMAGGFSEAACDVGLFVSMASVCNLEGVFVKPHCPVFWQSMRTR